MQVQIVRAPTRHKVLIEAKRRLGPDPLILSVRKQPTKEGEGFEWEAVVARETPATTKSPSNESQGAIKTIEELKALRGRLEGFQASPGSGGASLSDLLSIARRLTSLEANLLSQVLSDRGLSKSWQPLLDRLVKAGYPRADALRILKEADGGRGTKIDQKTLCRGDREIISQNVAVASAEERINPGLVVFVGGAGVGKTTLAAKLAADLCLGGSKRPVLGSLKPKKGAAVETLKRCAQALDIEFSVIQDERGLVRLAERSESTPVILDCATVNPRCESDLSALRSTLGVVPSAEVHSVAPANLSAEDFDTTLSAFSWAGAKRLSVTKLDESPFVGRFMAAAARARVPIGYISRGPQIPDDLVRPGLESLMDAVFTAEGVAV